MFKIITTLITLTLVGCSSSSKPILIKAYDNQHVNSEKTALIKPVAFIIVSEIDGNPSYKVEPNGPFTIIPDEYEIELLEGQHSLLLGFNNGGIKSKEERIFNISVEAGKKYILQPFFGGGMGS